MFRFTNDPLENILRLQRSLERALTTPLAGLDWTPSGRGVYPALNFFEQGDVLLVKAELPGMDREKLSVEVEDNRLTLSGERTLRQPAEGCSYHRREREGGAFRRTFRLPFAVDREKTTAAFRDGVLTVRLEKADSAKPRQIQVQA